MPFLPQHEDRSSVSVASPEISRRHRSWLPEIEGSM